MGLSTSVGTGAGRENNWFEDCASRERAKYFSLPLEPTRSIKIFSYGHSFSFDPAHRIFFERDRTQGHTAFCTIAYCLCETVEVISNA